MKARRLKQLLERRIPAYFDRHGDVEALIRPDIRGRESANILLWDMDEEVIDKKYVGNLKQEEICESKKGWFAIHAIVTVQQDYSEADFFVLFYKGRPQAAATDWEQMKKRFGEVIRGNDVSREVSLVRDWCVRNRSGREGSALLPSDISDECLAEIQNDRPFFEEGVKEAFDISRRPKT